MSKFEPLTEEEKKQMVDIFVEKIKEDRNEMPDANGRYAYQIELQDEKFEIWHTDEEVKKMTSLAVDAVEELKKLNTIGYDRAKLDSIMEEQKEQNSDEMIVELMCYEAIMSDGLRRIIDELCKAVRVDGAYKMLMVNPVIKSAFFNIFDYVVDQLDNSDMYFRAVYFILRAEMKIGSQPI